MKKKNKIIAIVQARLDSTRLPNKVLKKVKKQTIIEILYKRLKKSKKLNEIVIAIPDDKANKKLGTFLKNKKIKVFFGSKYNVLNRYYKAAKKFNANVIVRITGDCPLVDPKIVDQAIKIFETKKCDYVSNTLKPTYPDGLDTEVFSVESLKKILKSSIKREDKEHVTTYIKRSKKFKKINFKNKFDYSKENWTLDEQEDFDFFERISFGFEDTFAKRRRESRLASAEASCA